MPPAVSFPARGPVSLLIVLLALPLEGVCRRVEEMRSRPSLTAARGVDGSHSVEPFDTAAISVFFSRLHDGNQGAAREDESSIDRRAASLIARARRSIDCAFYELRSRPIADALLAARRRGVRVRLVGDSDFRDNPDASAVAAAGIPIVWDDRSALMHNKFFVVDGEIVWTGSWNLTDNCSFRNDNNAMAIRSIELAANFTAEFEEMFVDGRFGARSPSQTPWSKTTVGGADIYTYFSPEDDVRAKVLRFVRVAKRSIRILAFSFSDDEIADRLLAQIRAGVSVEGVFEARGSGAAHSDLVRLNHGGAHILPDGNRFMMHHKVMIIDDLWTITGSFNFTKSAAESNDENLLVIKSREIASLYTREYLRVAGAARPAAATAE